MPYEKDQSKEPCPLVFGERWQKEIAEDATRYGYIGLDHLQFIMPKETD